MVDENESTIADGTGPTEPESPVKSPVEVPVLSGFPGDPKDWLLNGNPIRAKHHKLQWDKLDWSRAWLDMGPSPAGNPGPYWHVPWNFQGEELWARLYPKLMLTRHLTTLQRIALDAVRLTPSPREP